MSTRRDFLKSGCTACLLVASGASLLEGCASALPMVKVPDTADKQVKVDASNFIPGKVDKLVIRSKQLENDILLIKHSDTDYRALYLKCTHEGVNLNATNNRIYCNSHGSSFDLEGNVLKEPALRPLKKFTTQVANNQIIIHIS